MFVIGLIWTQIWESALQCVASNQAVHESHSFVQTLILRGKSRGISQLYNSLFVKRMVKCNPDSIRTLLVLTQRCSVPLTAVDGSPFG